jgi:hypothetical protein
VRFDVETDGKLAELWTVVEPYPRAAVYAGTLIEEGSGGQEPVSLKQAEIPIRLVDK